MPDAAGSMDWYDIGHFPSVGWRSLLSIQVPVVENHCGETSRAPLNRIETGGKSSTGSEKENQHIFSGLLLPSGSDAREGEIVPWGGRRKFSAGVPSKFP